ncbi:MAG: hypothetical protein IKA22_03800 [Lentisphaeria bacterium]|nr:hypothetical protein [Lentisphaeria bacterium]
MADDSPLGYPDGWNNLAYCNNKINRRVDLLELSELDAADYRKFIESQLAQSTKNINSLFENLSCIKSKICKNKLLLRFDCHNQ